MVQNINVVSESKTLYTNALVKLLTGVIYQTFKQMYSEIKDQESKYTQFQTKLQEIKEWDKYKIKAFYNCCDIDKEYISRLLLVIFKLNIKILNIINETPVGTTNLPSLKQFIYNILLNTAQDFYYHPFVFESNRKKLTNHDISKNINKRKKIIQKNIINTIEEYLPIKAILIEPQNIISITTENSNTSEKDNKTQESIHSVSLELMGSDFESEGSC